MNYNYNRFSFHNLDLRKVANRLGVSNDVLPKEDEPVIFIYDQEEDNRFLVTRFENGEDCYEAFQEMCRGYEDRSHKRHSRISVEFPRGCFELSEFDEPCEDYGDLLLVWEGNILILAAQLQNVEYYA